MRNRSPRPCKWSSRGRFTNNFLLPMDSFFFIDKAFVDEMSLS